MAIADIYCDCMKLLFFELIQVAIGRRERLSHTPTEMEWRELYAMAEKQAVIGICFCGVQRFQRLGYDIPMDLYMKWLGMAAKIQQRNEVVNAQCVEVQKMMEKAGFRTYIMKGQGNSALYRVSYDDDNDNLCLLRQSGDIDIYLDGGFEKVNDFVQRTLPTNEINELEIHYHCLQDTEVEIHSQPSWMYGRKADKVLQRFFCEKADEQFENMDRSVGFSHPTVGFNLVYLLVHINRHIFEEGIGFRQLMDYYFTLITSNEYERAEAIKVLSALGLMKFAQGIMYIEKKVFGISTSCMLCEADKSEGEFLLKDILVGGNFGKYDKRNVILPTERRFARGLYNMKRNMRYFVHYPSEVISIPFWKLWHYCWRKRKGYL